MTTHRFVVSLDAAPLLDPNELAEAIAKVLNHTLKSTAHEVEGAEAMSYEFVRSDSVQVKPYWGYEK